MIKLSLPAQPRAQVHAVVKPIAIERQITMLRIISLSGLHVFGLSVIAFPYHADIIEQLTALGCDLDLGLSPGIPAMSRQPLAQSKAIRAAVRDRYAQIMMLRMIGFGMRIAILPFHIAARFEPHADRFHPLFLLRT